MKIKLLFSTAVVAVLGTVLLAVFSFDRKPTSLSEPIAGSPGTANSQITVANDEIAGELPKILMTRPQFEEPENLDDALSLFELAVEEGPQSDLWGSAIGSLADFGEAAETEMIERIRSGATGNALQAAAETVARISSPDGVEVLLQESVLADGEDREILLGSLDLVRDEESINLLASVFTATDDPDLLEATRRNLARAATSDTVEFLYEMYREDASVDVQQQRILDALEMVHSPAAIPALGELVAVAGEPELNLVAARSLAKSGTVEALIALAEQAEYLIREAGESRAQPALEAIASFQGEGSFELMEYFAEGEENHPLIAEAAAIALEAMTVPLDLDDELGDAGDLLPRSVGRSKGKLSVQ